MAPATHGLGSWALQAKLAGKAAAAFSVQEGDSTTVACSLCP